MIILALDTTTRGGSVAVADGDRMLAVLKGDESRTHGERLPGEIARALEQAGIERDRIDLFAVATGPGAFTGLRIGLAAIQGLSMTLNKPVAGVSALDALAEQIRDSDADVLIPWMDAQRGDVFATLIDRRTGATLEIPAAANPTALLESWRSHLTNRRAIFIGDAATRDAALIEQAGASSWETRAPAPLAPQIAILGRRRAERGEAGPPHALEPIYVRRPDAEIERDRRQS
ncbi:MAG TPA: tRNA (adenosine(37)-N6)-threonylcarbamoyltransferase complex dimerization subunit type 1 TsaB [Vicinamibacterales bacterium]|nr:tRNA (adenosine(37)-N6)-threonylcarbamoyltransferase complex dimerization subunit type 1 TsaB [Vicinamibacterales bacterium]